jgi:hypothetical protein
MTDEFIMNRQDFEPTVSSPTLTALLCCPFCGSKATMYECNDGWYVDCTEENDCDFIPTMQNGYHKKEDAVAKWNKRAT